MKNHTMGSNFRNNLEMSKINYIDEAFIFYTENEFFFASYSNGKIYLQHNIIKKDVDTVYNAFKEEFGNRYKWDKESKNAMIITLNEI